MRKETKNQKRYKRHKRIRAKIFGTALRPRLCVFRSAKHIYAQVINDENGTTLVSASDFELGQKNKTAPKNVRKLTQKDNKLNAMSGGGELKTLTKKIAIAWEVGKLIAKKSLEKNIKKVIFDRGGYIYHGRIKALAQGAREGGLEF